VDTTAAAPVDTSVTTPASPVVACPVTAAVLVAALKNSPEIYERTIKPETLDAIECFDNFATGKTPEDGKSQPARILFGYDVTAKQWRALNLGTATICDGYVPTELAKKFDGCR
jgi:hypothetical protein